MSSRLERRLGTRIVTYEFGLFHLADELVGRSVIAYGRNPNTRPVGIGDLRYRGARGHHQGVVELEDRIREISDVLIQAAK